MGVLGRSAVLSIVALLTLTGCGSGIAGNIATTAASLQVASSLPTAVSGMMYSSSLQASGGGSSHYNWAVVSGAVPTGLQLEKTSGVISGVPETSGTADFSVAITDEVKAQALKIVPVSIRVVPQLSVTDFSMPAGTVGTAYSRQLAATGGQSPYIWSVGSGQLPPGITAKNGVFSGTPTTAGTYKFTYQITDSGIQQVLSLPLTIQVVSAPKAVVPLTVAAVTPQKTTTGTAFALKLSASGGSPAYTWALVSGSLPSGLNLSTSTGIISGTASSAGSYTATVGVKDSASVPAIANTAVSINVVSPLSLQVPTLSPGTVNSPYTAAFQVSGGTPGYHWSSTGSLPAGLSLSGNGVLTGTPTAAGAYTFTAQVADSDSPAQTRTATATVTIANAPTPVAAGTTWYVRKDGGTRYSANRTNGQCDGKSDTPYSGVGVNQHCAFNDVRFLWLDGTYNSGAYPAWIIAGGDTVIIRGSLDSGASYRIGWNNKAAGYEQATDTYWGSPGDPYGSGMPVPPAGTASQHTRILGENYGSCHTQARRTQLHGGFGVASVADLRGASYVDMQCLDITDFSACGRAAQSNQCNTNIGSLDDYATNGIAVNNLTNHLTLTDVRIHGLAGTGLAGPTGDGVVMTYVDLIGNAASGWNADNGTVGVGSTLMQNFSINWNGCAEQYPIKDALPYADCTDDNVGGYGDGFGTATINGTTPWNITFDNGVVSYNTQDGLDALHLVGAGSSMTITRVLAYGNMGQQIKVGGAGGSAINNVIVANCNAMRTAIPGTPAGYNAKLSDFCRASDTGIYMAVQDGSTVRFDYNTVYSAAATTVQIGCGGTCTAGTDNIEFRNNILLGFKNSAANGYVNGGTNDYANPIYVDGTHTFLNAASTYDHNVTFHAKSNWTCANSSLKEKNAVCADPGLVDETWHIYDAGVMSPVPGASLALGAGVVIPDITTSFNGLTRAVPPTIGGYE